MKAVMAAGKNRISAILCALLLVLAMGVLAVFAFMGAFFASGEAGQRLDDFSDDFESYAVGNYIEQTDGFKAKWGNNVIRGGEEQGMDSHLREKAKIVYQNGADGNKVLAVNNTTGTDTFFYAGIENDFRVKNFTAEMKVRFLVAEVEERSWVGFSFRKKNNVHYTGTNNLLFTVQRYKNNTVVSGHGYVVQNGGSTTDATDLVAGGLYGEKLQLTRSNYTVPWAEPGEDFADFINVKLVAKNNTYKLYADDELLVDCTFDIPLYNYFGYLSINCCTANIQIDDVKVTVQDTTLPPVIPQLEAPQVTDNAEAKKIEWERVTDADGYRVQYGDVSEMIYATSFSYAKLKEGEYDFTVTALPADAFENRESAPSEAVHVVVAASKPASENKGCKGSLAISCGAFGGVMLLLAAGALVTVRRRRA